MSKKNSKQAFISAVKARGGLKHYDLGGGVDLAPTTTSGGGGSPSMQGGLIGALTPQSNYGAQLAPTTQLNYTPVTQQAAGNALAGYGQSQNNLANQQALEQTFLQQGQGGGPDPVQHQLAMNTQTNVNNQAALAAGQRGASSNVGLMSRNIAKQGAATQQQAAGQAATLGAQQQLAAYDAAAKQQQAIAQGIASQTAASNQMFATGAGANNTQNANLVSNYNQMQGINAATTMGNTGIESKMVGDAASGFFGGMGSAMMAMAKGGKVEKTESETSTPVVGGAMFADGGDVGSSAPMPNMALSFAGKFLSGGDVPGSSLKGQQAPSKKKDSGSGSVDASMEPEPYAGPDTAGGAAMLAAKGGKIKTPVTTSGMAAKGMDVPGKAKVKGDSLKNDTVPAMLSPDEIVLPRSVTTAGDAPARAAKFVQAIQAKQGMKRKAKK